MARTSRSRPSRARPPRPQPSRTPGAGNGPTGQVGRRPSRPGFLGLVGVMWVVVGVVELVALDASWRFVPGIVFIGIGLFFLRGAAVTVARREGRSGPG